MKVSSLPFDHLELVFTKHRLFIEPKKHPLAFKWATALHADLNAKKPLERRFSALGFIHSHRNLPFLKDEISRLTNELAERNSQSFHPWSGKEITQEELNRLHHDFEKFIGQSWKHHQPYLDSDKVMKDKVGELNFLIHEAEAYLRSQASFQQMGRYWPVFLLHFKQDQLAQDDFLLDDDDYDYFTESLHFGDIRLQYAQLGKTPMDAWRDGDQFIDEENIQGPRYFSSGCEVRLGPDSHQLNHQEKVITPFKSWLKDQGYQPNTTHHWYLDHQGRKQGFGHLIVAHCPLEQFAQVPIDEIQQRFSLDSQISRICLYQEGRKYEYDY